MKEQWRGAAGGGKKLAEKRAEQGENSSVCLDFFIFLRNYNNIVKLFGKSFGSSVEDTFMKDIVMQSYVVRHLDLNSATLLLFYKHIINKFLVDAVPN